MFLSNSIKVFLLIGFLSLTVNGEFPDDPKPCKYGDTECITKLINSFMNEKYKGDDSINLIDIDPLPIKKLILQQGNESPVSIKMVFTDNLLHGLKTAKVKTVKGFGKDLSQKHNVVISFDYLSLVGNYDINGKILILPISGQGKSNITMVNPDLIMEFTGAPYEKDGATYMKIDKMFFDAIPKTKLIFDMKNLFNGDKALGDNMNLFLNENWNEIYAELRTAFGVAFKKFSVKIINKVFTKYPYDKYFIE